MKDDNKTLAYFLLGINLDSLKGWVQLVVFTLIAYCLSYIADELSGFGIGIVAIAIVLLRIFLAANAVAKWHYAPIAKKDAEIAELTEKIAQIIKESQAECEKMRADIEVLEANCASLEAEKKRAEKAYYASQAALKQATEAISSYIAERDNAYQAVSTTEARIDKMRAEWKQTEAMYNSRVAELNQKVEELQTYYNATQRLQQYKPLLDAGLTARRLISNENIANSISKTLAGAGKSAANLFEQIKSEENIYV